MGIFKAFGKLFTGLWKVFLIFQKYLGMFTLGIGWIVPYFFMFKSGGEPAGLVFYCILLTIAIRDLYKERKAKKALLKEAVEETVQPA